MKDLDIVVYGATGFTGKLCAEYIHASSRPIKWAIAGRSADKLKMVQGGLSPEIEIIIADGDDDVALKAMTARAKVILSTAGPFHRYGSRLVAACVENSTHYVDITGENFWVKDMIQKHHEAAAAKGVRIIPSCGFDSIPSDLGSFFGIRKLGAPIKRVESFHSFKGGASGGTLETIFSIGDLDLKDELADPFLLNPPDSYNDEMHTKSRDTFEIAEKPEISGWGGPFVMAAANTRVVRRSAALLSQRQEPYGSNFTYQEFAFNKSRGQAIRSALGLGAMALVVMTPLRKLVRPLLKQPGEGPTEAERDNGWFDCKFIVETESGKKSVFVMHGKGDPGYKVTSKLVSECALCLVENAGELPGGDGYGGVLTSASGLGEALIARLSKVGIHFDGPFNT